MITFNANSLYNLSYIQIRSLQFHNLFSLELYVNK